jgi:AcrR family transcriptional regulator
MADPTGSPAVLGSAHRVQSARSMDKTNPRIWRKQPKQDRSEHTAAVILEAAEELFTNRGFQHATSDDIAERAGVGVGSVYDYFPNKAGIALAVLERTALGLTQEARRLLVEKGAEPIEVNLPKVIRGLYEGYKRHRRVMIDLVADVPELRTADVFTLDRLLHRATLLYLEQYRDRYPTSDLAATHTFLLHVFAASVRHYLAAPEPPMAEDEFLTRLSELIVGYLVNPRLQL